MYNYPYGDNQQINLNWIISEIIALHQRLDPDYTAPTFTQIYPFSETQQLNLDWILTELKALKELAPTPAPTDAIDEVGQALIAGAYDSDTQYQKNDYIVQDGKVYRANAATTGTFDPTKWREVMLGDDLAIITRWADATNTYLNNLAASNVSNDSIVAGDTVKDALATLNGAINALGTEVDTAKIVLDDGTVIDDNANTTYIRIPRQLVEFTFEKSGKIFRRTRESTSDPWGTWTPIATKSMFNRTECNAVFFGDSWTVGTGIATADRPTKRFSAIIAQKLECTEFNYGVGAAGFIRTGNLISTQISTASSGMSTSEKYNTGVVVIVGGVNDYRQQLSTSTVNDFITGVINTATLAHNTFPNAIIVLGIGNTNLSYFPQAAKQWYQWAIRAADAELKFPHITIKNLYNVISGLAENYSSDNLHPNETGHARFGGYIADAILGGGQDVSYYVQDVELETGFSWGTTGGVTIAGKLYRENDEFVITPCYMSMANAISANTQYGSIPEKMAPSQNMYGQFYRSNQIKGASAIAYSGGLFINPTESVTSGFISQLRWFFGKEINNDES